MPGESRRVVASRRVHRLLCEAMLLASAPVSRVDAQPEPARVLLLYAHPTDSPIIERFDRRLRATIRDGEARHVELYEERLDLDRFGDTAQLQRLTRYLEARYRERPVDVVVAEGALALDFAATYLAHAIPAVPVVYALVAGRAANAPMPRAVTGRETPFTFAETFDIARRLQPDATQLVLVGGQAPRDSVAIAAALRDIEPVRGRLPVTVLRGLTVDTLRERVRRLPSRTIVLLALFRRDERGRTFYPGEEARGIVRASSAPVYAIMPTMLGEGIVGGALIDPDEEGWRTGRLVLRVLARTPGEPMPPPERAWPTPTVDGRQLERWGLDARRLSGTTLVRFRTPGLWARHGLELLVGGGIILLQSVTIGLLLVERRRRIRVQRAVAARTEYERTISDLTADALRHAPEDVPRGLEGALERVARFAGASSALLTQRAESAIAPPTRLIWRRSDERDAPLDAASSLSLPLVAGGVSIGTLELHRGADRPPWPPSLAVQLEAAGMIIAGAIARSRAAAAMRREEALNRAVLDSLPTQIAILTRDGTIARVNDTWRAAARRGGVHEGAFLGTSYLEECGRAATRGCGEAEEARVGIGRVLAREAPSFRMEYHWTTPDVRWYELYVDRLEHEAGGAIVTHLDVTDRHLAELEAEERRRQLAHMGRVALVGELAAAIAHELQQPLAAIRANAEAGAVLLERSSPDMDEARQIFREIVADDARAAEVIHHVRALLRNEDVATSAVDVNAVCRGTARLLRRGAIQRRTRLELQLEEPLPSVVGHAGQLQQALLNLGLNALDAASEVERERVVTFRTRRLEEAIEVAVHDSGAGLGPDVQRHLFESYFSTKAHGLGLGLVIVRAIAERHQGRVHAENDPTGGAVFRIVLPVAGATAIPGLSTPADVARR